MSDRHPFADLAVLYAAGGLSREEKEAFEAHLEECDRCREEVREFSEVAAELVLSLPRRSAPEAVKGRILARVEAEAAGPAGSEPASSGAAEVPERTRAPRAPVPGEDRSQPRPPSRTWVSAGWALAATLILALGALLWWENSRSAAYQAEVAALEAELQELEAELGTLAAQQAEWDALAEALLSPDLRAADLTSPEEDPSARFLWTPERDLGILLVFRVPPADAGRAYQLWGISEDQAPVSLAVFDSDPAGRAVLRIQVPEGVELTAAAVSEEPAGGSPQPTSAPFLVGSLATGL